MAHKQAGRLDVEKSDHRSELWVKTPYWDKDVEDAYQDWSASGELPNAWSILQWFLSQSLGVSIKELQGAYCVTLSNADRKSRGVPCLLSGWGGEPEDACRVVLYKHKVLLDQDWDAYSKEEVWKRPRR